MACCELYAALECDPDNVPIFGDQVLQMTRKHAACTKGVRKEDRDFWTNKISMTYSQNDPKNP
jgi:hypothetical protein